MDWSDSRRVENWHGNVPIYTCGESGLVFPLPLEQKNFILL